MNRFNRLPSLTTAAAIWLTALLAPSAVAQVAADLPEAEASPLPASALPQPIDPEGLTMPTDEELLAFIEKAQPGLEALNILSVQDDGRRKTLHTLAAERLTAISGSSSLSQIRGVDDEHNISEALTGHDPLVSYLDLTFRNERYADEPIIRIKKPVLYRPLLNEVRDDLSPQEIARLEKGYLSPTTFNTPDFGRRLTRYERDIMLRQRHVAEIKRAASLTRGVDLFVMPMFPPKPREGEPDPTRLTWLSLLDVSNELRQRTGLRPEEAAMPAPSAYELELFNLRSAFTKLQQSWGRDADTFNQVAQAFTENVAALRPDVYPSEARRSVELMYVNWSKFTWVWFIYFVSAVLLLMTAVYGWKGTRVAGIGLFALAFVLHTVSLGLRWYLAGRIPIATQFESMLTAAWFTGVVAIFYNLWPRFWRTLRLSGFAIPSLMVMLGVAVTCGYFLARAKNPGFIVGVMDLELVTMTIAGALVAFTLLVVMTLFIFPNKASPAMAGGGEPVIDTNAAIATAAPAGALTVGGGGGGGFFGGSAGAAASSHSSAESKLSPSAADSGSGAENSLFGLTKLGGKGMVSLLMLLASAVSCMIALMFGAFLPVTVGTDIRSIMPILNDTLLYIHVNMVILSYGLITMAAVVAGVYLGLNRYYHFKQQTASFSLSGKLGVWFAAIALNAAAVIGLIYAAAMLWTADPVKLGSWQYVGWSVWILSFCGYLAYCFHQSKRGMGNLMTIADGKTQTPASVLDGSSMILIHLSFITLWVGIALGAWWADYSWGRPWGWDPKEVFALITWILLLIPVHVRLRLAGESRIYWTAVLAVIAFFAMVFNYSIVNYVISGLHSYA